MSDLYKFKMADESLSHHGIEGQKWGVKNGPPYPLDAGDHSAAEKRASSQKHEKAKQVKKEYEDIDQKYVDKVKEVVSSGIWNSYYEWVLERDPKLYLASSEIKKIADQWVKEDVEDTGYHSIASSIIDEIRHGNKFFQTYHPEFTKEFLEIYDKRDAKISELEELTGQNFLSRALKEVEKY